MLRLHPYEYHRPDTVTEAVSLLTSHGTDAMAIAGGTDLVPNMKHRLFTPGHLVSLDRISEMRGIRMEDGEVRIGALETLTDVSEDHTVISYFPGLAKAAGMVAGPQLRNRGTIGGNVCLDTRCTYYNQTEFWRKALGYCLKKDGTVCHVTKVGKKCVAAHSADTPGMLMALGASLVLVGPDGPRTLPVEEFFIADGIYNSRRAPNEVLLEIRIRVPDNQRSAYQKLRQRGSIDFPLLSIAVVGTFGDGGQIDGLTGVVSALGSRPKVLTGWEAIAQGRALTDEVVDELSERAGVQCRPLENLIVDTEWRRAMVPVYVKRALLELRGS